MLAVRCFTRAMAPRASMLVGRAASNLVSRFEESVAALPMREAVRYIGKNMKWTASEVKGFVDAHANALLEQGFKKGEVLALWVSPNSAEKHVTLLAAAKIGLKVVDVDTSLSSVADLRQVLASSACKAIIFEPVSASQDNLLMLRKAIPEFFYYDDKYGQEFHSKHFPALKYFIHTGFDIETGCLNYKSLFLTNPQTSAVDAFAKATSDDLPFYAKAAKGGSVSFISQAKALEDRTFDFANKFIGKQYFETV